MGQFKTYAIRHKETGEMFRARSGKTSWKQPAHAKNAFNNSLCLLYYCEAYEVDPVERVDYRGKKTLEPPRFAEQDVWEVVELKMEQSTQLDRAIALLQECLGRCDYNLQSQIETFLKEVEND